MLGPAWHFAAGLPIRQAKAPAVHVHCRPAPATCTSTKLPSEVLLFVSVQLSNVQ